MPWVLCSVCKSNIHCDYLIFGLLTNNAYRIGAAILSHFVDDFTLVSAFFLFSLGCLNIFVGLIFREKAKSKRSLTSWREHAKSAIPTHVAGVNITPVVNGVISHAPSFVSNVFGDKERHSTASDSSMGSTSSKPGMGFGRQGEKAAAMKGMSFGRLMTDTRSDLYM